MNSRLFFIVVPFVTVSFFAGLVLGEGIDLDIPYGIGAGNATDQTGTTGSLVDTRLLDEAYEILRDHYIDYPGIDKKALAEGVVRGMVE